MTKTLIKRYFVEKKDEFDQASHLLTEFLQNELKITSLESVKIYQRYDIAFQEEDLDSLDFIKAFLAEPQTDVIYEEKAPINEENIVFAIEALPGQFDQRADSCEQGIEIIINHRRDVKVAQFYVLSGNISEDDLDKIKKYLINPVEMQEAGLEKPISLEVDIPTPKKVPVIDGFIDLDDFTAFKEDFGLAMGVDDLEYMQKYFKNDLKRNPTETELRVVDTYWSDHCRHTTFNTAFKDVEIRDDRVLKAYERYQLLREEVYEDRIQDKPEKLMDMATIATKTLKKRGKNLKLDESEEINACSVRFELETKSGKEDWLYMFKNETHNHPTEIEPFGGAATCLGGAIRDPLSGRSYVYQGMRITGAADPRTPINETRVGKLPQRQICRLSRDGFASYGNQIGLPTGLVDEVYHPGYEAKRMEIGAVVAAAPSENVVREKPSVGDVVVLVGGRTGRDGCGGATGSSVSHTEDSLTTAGAEVQKGNPVEERKIQRLFRDEELAKAIKRCNDFGAGGVSVAVGELADGVKVYLDRVPKKYEGLNGTELAISESQERMACVIHKSNWDMFKEKAERENLEATIIADITDDDKMTILWQDDCIVSLDRSFLDSAGAPKETNIVVPEQQNVKKYDDIADWKDQMFQLAKNINVASKRGLVESFDATVGANTVLMPFGGTYQRTPIQTMVAKIPTLNVETTSCSMLSWGFNPEATALDPYQGSYNAVVESVLKLIATGAAPDNTYLTLQEYFPSVGNNPEKWGLPFAALLGALDAQIDFEIPAIGGKDSMSGTFEDLEVPPTLVSFATKVDNVSNIISPELKKAGHKVALVEFPRTDDNRLNTENIHALWSEIHQGVQAGKIVSAWAVGHYGAAEGLFKMCFGNRLGINIADEVDIKKLFASNVGAIIIETTADYDSKAAVVIGEVNNDFVLKYKGEHVDLAELIDAWETPLENIYETKLKEQESQDIPLLTADSSAKENRKSSVTISGMPKVVVPIFPGINCEYETYRGLVNAGGDVETFVIRNKKPDDVKHSITKLSELIKKAQMLVLPGGFSFGDEPDGSAKLIAAFFQHPQLKEAVNSLLSQQDGLILGICNGFQALVKMGLLPYGTIQMPTADSPTLTFNKIQRHQSRYVHTRITSTKSPWLQKVQLGDIHSVPVSHGEGRFMASDALIEDMRQNGQIITQYVDLSGNPTMDVEYNPNNSTYAIEGIISKDGRILGKMGHSERIGHGVTKNIPGSKEQHLFESGIEYFK